MIEDGLQSLIENTRSLVTSGLSSENTIGAFKVLVDAESYNGLSTLINYAADKQIDLAELPLRRFKSSVERNLNESFNMSNLLVFMKYFTHVTKNSFHKYHLSPSLNAKNSHKLETIKRVQFALKEADVVNMPDLFGLLVNKIGQRTILDKQSGQDVLKSMIQFFTDYTLPFAYKLPAELREISCVRESDIAQYHLNHLKETSTLGDVLSTSYKLHNLPVYQNNMIEGLKHKMSKGKLPSTFGTEPVRQQYLKLKTHF